MTALSKQWPIKRLRYLTSRNSSDSRRARLAHVSEASFLPMEAIGSKDSLICPRFVQLRISRRVTRSSSMAKW